MSTGHGKEQTFLIWDNTPLFVKYNPGLLDLLVLLDETGLRGRYMLGQVG